MISGTSKMSLNLDPSNGQIWTRGPRTYGLYYTKILQTISESIWEHPGKYYFHICESENLKTFVFLKALGTAFLLLLRSQINIFSEDEDRKMITIASIKSTKAWM